MILFSDKDRLADPLYSLSVATVGHFVNCSVMPDVRHGVKCARVIVLGHTVTLSCRYCAIRVRHTRD